MMTHYSVLVLGAGMSGLCMGIKLKQAGIDRFLILEKSDGVGGTWRSNTYPGVACDVPSQLYSYSFKLLPDWSRRYPVGAEILNYCEECVEEFGLKAHLRFQAHVEEVSYENTCWHVQLRDGTRLTSDMVVVGIGGLHVPNRPRFEGEEQFQGPIFHSAEWDHSFDLTSKKVALVGTGASAVQIGPEIATQVHSLYVMQRSAAWVLPRLDGSVGRFEKNLLKLLPLTRRLKRALDYFTREALGLGYTTRGSLLNRIARWIAVREIRRTVQQKSLSEKLIPNYDIGCKRLCLSDTYYPMFNRENVHLVTAPVEQLEATGIRTSDGLLHEVDAIITATGFRAFDLLANVRFRGRGGVQLEEQWNDGPRTYKTVMIDNFPNLFLMYGPNSGTGHMSALQMIEAQSSYVISCIELMERRGLRSIEPTADAVRTFDRDLQETMAKRVFGGGCNAWYTDSTGRNHSLWPRSTANFRSELRTSSLQDFVAVATDENGSSVSVRAKAANPKARLSAKRW